MEIKKFIENYREAFANMLNCLSYSGTRTFLKMKRGK